MNRAILYVALFVLSPTLSGYSVLTHEAIIDSAWDRDIKLLLLKRFPNASPESLVQAHGYAYGGCIIQDMGYYPFGSRFFSDLVHYVRSGDYVVNQLAEAQDLNEYAFALGSLAHYAADNAGHSIAVNPSVGMEYPKLRRQYGKVVTYADDPVSHLKVEFGFDVVQVAHGNYAPQSYHDFIGFYVAKPVMERAFHDTYGIELKDVFTDLDLALGSYRHAVSSVIPEMTKVAWSLKKKELAQSPQPIPRARFIYNLSRASYEKEWDRHYQKPGAGARLIAFLFHLVPKVGPFRAAAFKIPTTQSSRLFQDSFDRALDLYRKWLGDAGRKQLQLPDTNFDTGEPTAPAKYSLADNAYAKLAVKLAEKDAAAIDPKMRDDVLLYYRDLTLPYATKKDTKDWSHTVAALDKLKLAKTAMASARAH